VISAGNDEPGVGQSARDNLESLEHQFETFISSPLTESENAMLRIAADIELRILRAASENAVRAQVNIVASVFVMENPAVAGHEHGDRVRHQEHPRGNGAGEAIEAHVADTCVFEVDSIHQVVQGDVRIAAAHAREQRREQSEKCIKWIAAKGAEQQVEPDHIRLQLANHLHQANRVSGIVERPAALDGEAIEFGRGSCQFIGQNGQAEKRIAAQLLSNVKPVFAQPSLTGRKGGDQANFHWAPDTNAIWVLMTVPRKVLAEKEMERAAFPLREEPISLQGRQTAEFFFLRTHFLNK
jgi:hypothetical protein